MAVLQMQTSRTKGRPDDRRDIGGTPGVDCAFPCMVFGRPCTSTPEDLRSHSCVGEPYAMRTFFADLDSRNPQTGR
jgi:hypothetical protein